MSPFWLYLCYVILFLKFVGNERSTASEIKSGPYRSVVTRSEICKKFSFRRHRDPPVRINFEIYNTSTRAFLTRGNMTFTRNVTNMKVKIKSYLWMKGKWRMNHLVDSLGCNEMLIPMLCSILNIKFDKKHCTFLKGRYQYEDVDLNVVSHLIAQNLEYGKTLWTWETYLPGIPFQTIHCQEYETWIVPA